MVTGSGSKMVRELQGNNSKPRRASGHGISCLCSRRERERCGREQERTGPFVSGPLFLWAWTMICMAISKANHVWVNTPYAFV